MKLLSSLLALSLPSLGLSVMEMSSAECDKSKRCLSSPPGCDPATNCKVAASWRKKNSNWIELELSSEGSGQYVALGFSSDAKMGKDYVVYCTEQMAKPRAKAYLAVNPQGQQVSLSLATNEVVEFATLVDTGMVNGRLVCRVSLNVNIPSSYRKYVDFGRNDSLDQPLRLFLVAGRVNDPGDIKYHDLAKILSQTNVNVADNSGLSAPPPPPMGEKAEDVGQKDTHMGHGHSHADGDDSHASHEAATPEGSAAVGLAASLLSLLAPLCLARLL